MAQRQMGRRLGQTLLSPDSARSIVQRMPTTLDQIVEEVRHWPQEQVAELVDRLTFGLHPGDPATDGAWKREARRRVAEIESGQVAGIPGEEVSARIRQIVGR